MSDTPTVNKIVSQLVEWDGQHLIEIHYETEMLKTADGATTALGLAIRLLTELSPEQLLLPLYGSEFPMHHATLDVIEVHGKVYVEIL